MTLVPIEARHPGRCGLGDDRIEPGDSIVEIDGEWCHASCAADDGHDVAEKDES